MRLSAPILFAVLILGLVAAPYMLRVAPTTSREWRYVAITLAFVVWVLLSMVPVRSM